MKKGVVAYYRPGDAATSFYLIVGERVNASDPEFRSQRNFTHYFSMEYLVKYLAQMAKGKFSF